MSNDSSTDAPPGRDQTDRKRQPSPIQIAVRFGRGLVTPQVLSERENVLKLTGTGVAVLVVTIVAVNSLALTPVPAPTESGLTADNSELAQSASGVQTEIAVDSVSPSNDTAVITFTHQVEPGFDDATIETNTYDAITVTDLNISAETGTIAVQFTVDTSDRDSYLTTMVNDRRLSVNGPDHEVIVSRGPTATTYNISEIHENTGSVTVSEDVSESTPLAEGTLVDGFVIVSPHEGTSQSLEVSGTETSLEIVDLTGGNTSVEWIAETLAVGETLIEEMDVSTPNRSLTVIVGETNTTSGFNGVAIDRADNHTTLYVDEEDARPGRSTVPHEWAHSIQHHQTEDSATWWIEGSAVYLSQLVRNSTAGYDYTGKESLMASTASTTGSLSDPGSWEEGSRINYDYGGQVVYLMDLAIRNATNGDATIIDYVDTLNQHDGGLTHDDLATTLEEYGATGFADSFGTYVNSTGASMHVGEEVHRHNLLVDEVGNPFTLTVELPDTPEIAPNYTLSS